MESLSSLTDPHAFLVADASTVINVNASGCALKVLEALPNRVTVVDVVFGELEEGRQRQRRDADLLKELADSGHVEIVRLDEVGEGHFEQLTIGPAQMTLDDGEAATIGHAVARNGVALIDEGKAVRICAQLYPALPIGCSVDIFAHPAVGAALGRASLADAVFNALCHGRMRVFPKHVEWVITLIGIERARLCTSLPNSVRGPKHVIVKQAGSGGDAR
jgi:predicted nucleic acid-binding protein